ncbi:hypothetical protein H257_03262 [Aphanomyces astaci]|uniref:Uncharacterized protein n=1 Tax=Aphanomyces astaci TaxID=112090 RepID=W4H2W1_APHAT|nr:hypothetical protein H257_03262 [Aphanomyces astaci]ETV85554.1 hypothetical protein H257_03262 [Aphanomyces astaci]|eukprot:XP_009825572.1 hypothetical protein H257_03262 [Aphanomyces astaci]
MAKELFTYNKKLECVNALVAHVKLIKLHKASASDASPHHPQKHSPREVPSFSLESPTPQAPEKHFTSLAVELPSMPTMPPLTSWLDERSDDE